MTPRLRPETEAKLAAHTAELGVSISDYLESLVERELLETSAEDAFLGPIQFQKEHGIWVYRTGDPMPVGLVDDTLDAMRREREARVLGNIGGSVYDAISAVAP
jgi:hypothetical protein